MREPLPPLPRPPWIRARAPSGAVHDRLQLLVRGLSLHTVCEEARCPNLGECWDRGTATFLVLGDVCTRACAFCAVRTGLPSLPPDPEEAGRVAGAVAHLGLRHAVVTSVDRDDLPDGGAATFAAVIRAIRERVPACTVEVLVPDFQGDRASLQVVIDARPDVLGHNCETVPRLHRAIRPGARFERSLEVLSRSREAGLRTKSGLMVGLGEEWDELLQAMSRIAGAGAEVLTLGQYLSPSPRHAPVRRYYSPDEFRSLREAGLAMGFDRVQSGPLVRSSYRAEEHLGRRREA